MRGVGTWRHSPSLRAAGVALGDIHVHCAWQGWRLRHWAGSGGAFGRRLGKHSTWRHPPLHCVSGMAFHDIHLHPPSLCVAGVARLRHPHSFFMAGHLRFALPASAFSLRGRRGTCGTGLGLVARLGADWAPTPRHFGWQAWHLATSTFVSRGRHGTW